MILTRGMATLKGSTTVDPAGPWDEDAPAVARLRAAGAVIFGKTTTTEFGGSPFSSSPLTGVTRNPWHTAYGCAGSSMGAAAQLAAGCGPLALANDAAGSIRMPASFAGVVGHKPTYGLVANYPPSAAGTLGHVGPMSRSVADAAALLDVIAGPDDRDGDSLPRLPEAVRFAPERGVAGLRIAYSRGLGLRDPDPEVGALADAAAARFEELGATVEAVDPDMPDLFGAYDILRLGNRAATVSQLSAEEIARLDPVVGRVVEMARSITTADYIWAERARARLKSLMRQFHARYDLLLTPTMATPPMRLDRRQGPDDRHWYEMDGEIWAPYTFAFNMTQQPAASVPCGLTGPGGSAAPGLPVGLQIVAAPFRDDLVLRAAAAFEAVAGVPTLAPEAEAAR
jgi:aspartyl-tRNA(Asn)/glutamyl-tRNA(Gln) amidotransferase subunit A